MLFDINVVYILILGCEIAFWALLFCGFSVRYLLNKKRLSFYILASVPLVDLMLLAFVIFDLNDGQSATFAHGLATAYIGFTIAFGQKLIAWADRVFANKVMGTDITNTVLTGWGAVIDDFKLWARCIFAVAIMYVLLILITGFVNDPSKTQALEIWFKIPFFTVFFWFIFGPLWSLVFFKRTSKS
ncbi:hypothetical protein A7985_06900 [Pseudoalteromonas luteoviolacea]|uniref:Uncharacterized protein n=1 Tax=Pseudoalteromonas luteoviolacea TaxID=43657 RepID=A0A1C0TWP9_9GAMM|nr:hypothetical protein [Pseudoalteromonas luteoviolacea]OCQ23664.1 hypothetical protein A7985_06900 [Pseudoalteromonas luteoviolacea]